MRWHLTTYRPRKFAAGERVVVAEDNVIAPDQNAAVEQFVKMHWTKVRPRGWVRFLILQINGGAWYQLCVEADATRTYDGFEIVDPFEEAAP